MVKWRKAHGWTYEIFPLDTTAETLDRLQPFRELWDSKRTGGILPAWRDFELSDFVDWYGWIVVEDVIPGDAYNSVIRLWGTNVTKLYGLDLTGKRTRDYAGEIYSTEDYDMSRELVKNPSIRLCSGPLDWKHGYHWRPATHYTLIQLPLANDGVVVDKLIMLIQPVPTNSP